MLIRQWMTEEVISVTPDTSVLKATKLMKDHNIGRLPVVDEDMQVVGIVSDRDVKLAAPSKATTLDMHELHYLLSELKVKEIMTKSPDYVSPDDSVEKVAMILESKNFGGMPVVENGKLVGVITDHDIFRIFINLTGARQESVRYALALKDDPGVLAGVLDVFRQHNTNIITVLSCVEECMIDKDYRHVVVSINPLASKELAEQLAEALQKEYTLLHWGAHHVKV